MIVKPHINIDCQNCECIDAFAKYSNFGYCSNPKNLNEFVIRRWVCDITGSSIKCKPSNWCIQIAHNNPRSNKIEEK